MARKLILGAIAVLVLYFGYESYMNWRRSHSLNNGDIATSDSDNSDKKTIPFNTDDQPKPVQSTPSRSDRPLTLQPSIAAAPSTDSQSPNAANGMKFTGSGKYQVYRQGNITYRVDTETGKECVLLATDEEWRKPRVYNRACGN